MLNTFEELYNRKLEPSQVALWKKFLLFDENYPERYFVRVVELAGELKWFPKISEIKERFYEYALEDGNRRVKLPEPRDYHKETARKWMAQIRTILSYGGLLREDFDHTKLGKLYTPEELKKLLDSNLKENLNKERSF
jgi:tRNA(Glu) U13 pseudouridine synthase TruD